MKRRCIKCEHGYNPAPGSSYFDVQCCGFGLKEGAAGTRDYVENRLPKPHKEKYSIREMIELTKGEYQAECFKKFFTQK